MFRGLRLIHTIAVAAALAIPVTGGAMDLPQGAARRTTTIIQGTVTTVSGTVLMPGVTVNVMAPPDATPVATVVSDEQGHYRVELPRGGKFRITTALDGFYPAARDISVASGGTLVLDIDLRLREIEQTVNVTPTNDAAISIVEPVGRAESIDGRAMSASAMSSGNIAAELRWLPGIASYGREWAIKGGLPNQIAVQVESVQAVDPAEGVSSVQLPGDAVNRIQVMANPYSVEFGRFSSGVVVVSTQRGTNTWRWSINNFLPGFILERGGNPFKPIGVQSSTPRFALGGPIVKDRLFIAHSTQLKYVSGEVSSRPQDQRTYTRGLTSFTRLDWVINPHNTLVGTVSLSPENASGATLGTFDPPEVTGDLSKAVYRYGVSNMMQLPHSMVLESLAYLTRSRASVNGHGTATDMVLAPEGNSGIYFSNQDRHSDAWQVAGALSAAIDSPRGAHLLKVGVDVLHAAYTGTILMRPVDIVREDGTLARRLTAEPSTQDFASSDASAYIRDRWLVSDRILVETGVRFDRDGVFNRLNVAPRIGLAVALDSKKNMTVRGGWGYFDERTPTLAGAFSQLSPLVESAYSASGALEGATTYTRLLAGERQTPRSVTWNVSYEQRVTKWLAFRFNHLHRDGSHELVLDTGGNGPTGVIALDSTGHARYRDTEVGAHVSRGTALDVDVSYTRSSSLANLNDAYSYYLNFTPRPVLRADAFGPPDTDTPNRFVARGRLVYPANWAFEVASEVRTGYPYSAVNGNLEFVGTRNSLRFPRQSAFDFSVERRFKVGKIKPWIGAVFSNPFRLYMPADVQRNVTSPAFGTFYGADIRQIRITVHFHP